jgi:hypothetical protein
MRSSPQTTLTRSPTLPFTVSLPCFEDDRYLPRLTSLPNPASFRIYFDSTAAGGQRRRRLLARDVSVPGSALRQTTTSNQNANAALTVPPNPNAVPATPSTPAQPAAPAQPVVVSSQPDLGIVIALAVTATALAVTCCFVIAAIAIRRRNAKKAEEDQAVQKLMATYSNLEGAKAPTWGAAV